MPSYRPLPGTDAIVREQLRAVSLFPGRYLLLAAAAIILTVAGGLVIATVPSMEPSPAEFPADAFIVLLLPAFIFPLLIWWGEPMRRRAYHYSMPTTWPAVNLSRAAGGLIWLLAIVGAFILGMRVIAMVTGGEMGIYHLAGEERIVPAWFWITPFFSASIAYTFGCALMIGTRQPVIWGLVAVYLPMIAVELAENAGGPHFLWVDHFVHGPFGPVPVMTGLTKQLEAFAGSGGVPVLPVYVPEFGTWLPATITWSLLAAVSLALALRRHHDV